MRSSPRLEALADDQLRKQSLALQYELKSGRSPSSLVVDTFSLVREAARRTLNMQHYPVQILGGLAMHAGGIAVMQTGEGKTLTATLPIVLAALSGQGAHLATANDYLAARDAKLMSPIYESLGLSVGVIQSDTSRQQRRTQYRCDITYSTAKEIGFDFLRDRLAMRRAADLHPRLIQDMIASGSNPGTWESGIRADGVQRQLHFMLVDEADSILIDEARTPLIVSTVPDDMARTQIALYQWCANSVDGLTENEHYEVDSTTRQVSLTAAGRQRVRALPKDCMLGQTPILEFYDQVELALFVERNYTRDRQYIVRDGEVVIVDEYTGRLAEGRKWRDGLHQAIEAREKLEISVSTGESARITIQDLFLRYRHLAGMTGTSANSAGELRKIYQLRTIQVPTNRPPQRQRLPDLVFATDQQKWLAITDEVAKLHRIGRPVLIGTRSIDRSDRLSAMLEELGIQHEVLNARNFEREAEIIARAGEPGRVTVATNMAGRGTDIKVSSHALMLGGLHVICTEIHDSARIDRQLIGRCGRQGDPGSFRQFFSLEDEILENGLGNKRADRLKRQFPSGSSELKRMAALFRKAQSRIERRHFRGRKLLLHQEKLRHQMQREMGQDPYLDTAAAQ